MKDDGTFVKLPKPKPGNKYIIQKKTIEKKSKSILKQPEKKARRRTNQHFGCSYKEIPNERREELINFISEIKD